MSDTESVDYLQHGFDPFSLTVPRLRSILVTHGVQYPANAKKSQLVDIFNDEVVPKSKKILAARARAKRSSKGIVDADSQSTTSTDFLQDDQDLMPPPPRSTRSRSPRKSMRPKRETEDVEASTPAPVRESPRKRQSRSVSAQAPAASDTDTGADTEGSRSTRRTRRTTPAVKLEPTEEDNFFKRTPETETVFSSDNPFQSGSSPPAVKTPSNRRRTAGFEPEKPKVASAARRRTDGPIYSSDESKAVSKSMEIPLPSKRAKTPEPTLEEPGEEFTPEEQLALNQEEQTNPQLAAARRKSQPTRRGRSLATPIWILLITLFGAYAAWYRQEKIAVGYCGVGRQPQSIVPSNIELPDWAQEFLSNVEVPDWALPLVEPQCENCPSHAYCYEDFSVRCEPDFILKPHPLSLGGLVPVPPTCEPDGEKARRVQAVADKAVEELRDRRAKYECGELLDEEGQQVETPAIQEQELKETISEKRSRRMTLEEFDDLWVAAIGEVKSREEVEVVEQPEPEPETGGAPAIATTFLSSSSLARLPYSCALRRSVKLGLARHRLSIAGVIFSLFFALYGRSRYLANRALSAQVPALVDEVLERLANQKEIAFEDGNDDAFLFLPNLRDDVLRSLHSLAARDRLWQRVKVVVEQNSNVRTGQREGRNGEVGRAWEWIGPSRPGIGDGAASRRRKSGRVSWGPNVKGPDPTVEMSENKTKAVHKSWEEARPIY
ncbi:hypothetical protein GQ53DRAFT_849982 [Thozetella sp. PMI_491]|nr:hypothetical protein GQ53DRAFT_849982 [Thozetella sp. PMI_491]